MIAFLQGIYDYLINLITFAFTYLQTIFDIIHTVVFNIWDAFQFVLKVVNLVPPVFYVPALLCLVSLVIYQILGREKGS